MKSIKTLLAIIVISSALFSCEKISATVEIGGEEYDYVPLRNMGGGGVCYPYGYIPQNVSSSICYIFLMPTSITAIPVFDQNRRQIGIVSCVNGNSGNWSDWRVFDYLQHQSYPCPVLVNWQSRTSNNVPWTGTIIGF